LAAVQLGDQSLTETMTQIAALAVSAVPGADGAGLTAMESERPLLIAASTDFVTAVDRVQYGLAEGPCIEAARMRRTQVCGSLGGEKRWPRFGPRAGRLGVHSALSLPLVVADRTVGSLNVYGRNHDAFTPHAVSIGERFSAPAAVTVANALLLEQSRRLTRQLEQALGSRTVIDQAVGILMSRSGATAGEAFETLKAISQAEGKKLVEVSTTLVTQAVAHARARRAAP
jgi:GAF domain-containing protein